MRAIVIESSYGYADTHKTVRILRTIFENKEIYPDINARFFHIMSNQFYIIECLLDKRDRGINIIICEKPTNSKNAEWLNNLIVANDAIHGVMVSLPDARGNADIDFIDLPDDIDKELSKVLERLSVSYSRKILQGHLELLEKRFKEIEELCITKGI